MLQILVLIFIIMGSSILRRYHEPEVLTRSYWAVQENGLCQRILKVKDAGQDQREHGKGLSSRNYISQE